MKRRFLERVCDDPWKYALRLVAAIGAALVLALLYSAGAKAAPIAIAVNGAVTVTLTDEPCAGAASQLVPAMRERATYRDAKGLYDGCYMLHQRGVLIVLYFAEDRSIALVPVTDLRAPEAM